MELSVLAPDFANLLACFILFAPYQQFSFNPKLPSRARVIVVRTHEASKMYALQEIKTITGSGGERERAIVGEVLSVDLCGFSGYQHGTHLPCDVSLFPRYCQAFITMGGL